MKRQTYESPQIEWYSFIVEGGFQLSQIENDENAGQFEEENFEF